ncbi:MAG TPA: FAD-dependent oxidoreductase, partial [Kofleriaceae bacterium]|nr:FAD-dependent oxidoreductase [Kofleriaceae bacterium]
MDAFDRERRLVVIGNGMVAARLIARLIEQRAGWHITVFGDEPGVAYDRIKLSSVLAGDAGWDELPLHADDWYRAHGIDLRLGRRVVAVDRVRRTVTTGDGDETPYDHLVLATGSSAVVLPVPGAALPGVVTFRTAADCRWLIEQAAPGRRAAVIGAGLLGLEAARGLQRRGMSVTVVHLVDRPMERQLDAGGGAQLARDLRGQGIDLLLDTATEAIVGDHRAAGLRFRGGRELAADLVVMAAGIRPNAELGRAAGLDCGRGVRVDDQLLTSDPCVSAVGECAEHRGTCYGLVAPLYQQADVLAARLCGRDGPGYAGTATSTRLKVSGIDVFSAGDPVEHDGDDVLRMQDSGLGIYRKAIVRDGRLIGAILVGDPAPAAAVDALLRSGRPLADADRGLLAAAGAPANAVDPLAAAEALAADAIVCGCNGVAKQTIVDAIAGGKLATRKQVAACTNASRSCGGCG